MKIVTFKDIKDLNISPLKCYEWVDDMILNKSKSILPPKTSIKPFDTSFCNIMPSIILNHDSEAWGGVKVVSRYPERIPSLDSNLILFNANNGEFIAYMDANWITAMRTGAVAAHSILLLAKSNFKEIGIIGLGNTARATLLVLLEKEPNRKFNIKLLSHNNQELSFIERFKDYDNLTFSIVNNYYDVVKGSEVVISAATYLENDICPDDAFDEGVLLVPIHTRGFTNCDLFFDKIFADDYGHICHFKNFNKFKKFAEITDVVNHRTPGRENDKERIIAYNIGLSIHDINFAVNIMSLLNEKNVTLSDLDLLSPNDKFWI